MAKKVFKSLEEQVQILKDKGLLITDEDKAKKILFRENYFFLSGYRHLFLEKNGQFHALLRGQKGAFLQDNGLVRGDLDSADGAGEAGGEGNHSRPALGGIDVLKDGIARKHAPESLAQAAGRSLHVHIRAHPAHGAFLCDHGLLGVELANDCGQGLANNLVLHFNAPLYDRN